MTTLTRRHSNTDRVLTVVGRGLSSLASRPRRPLPDGAEAETQASANPSASIEMMRINHAGEVSAQGLYYGQALLARDRQTLAALHAAAREEEDHLAWCDQRLAELGDRPSRLGPVWYVGSTAIGALAALAGDRTSMSFIVETERQVEAHLDDHLRRLGDTDPRSAVILRQMKADEAAHGAAARRAGGSEMPAPVSRLMGVVAGIMKRLSARI